RLAFVATAAGGRPQVWVRGLDALAAHPLAATEEASFPFWSPDGRSIGFFTPGKLKKIDAAGGPPQPLCDAAVGRGGTWNRDGTILFAQTGGGLLRVSAIGGPTTPASAPDPSRKEGPHRLPHFLPGRPPFLA